MKNNIIVIFTDQQRWDSMGCYGQELDVTPNLDKIAENGVLFTNMISCQPVCGPARAIMQTGRYATETECFRNGIALKPQYKTIAQYLSENGYKVGYIGKWHLASDNGASRKKIAEKRSYRKSAIPKILRGGYKDYWIASDVLEHTSEPFGGHLFNAENEKVEFKGYRVDRLTDFALEFLDKQDEDEPFFLFLSYLEPHQQNNYANNHHFVGPKGSAREFEDFEVPGDLRGRDGNWKENYADYLACCHSIDENVGRINEKLKELSMEENTYIIYTSDHGCHFRTRNREYKRSCHEASVHVPLILKGPKIAQNKPEEQLVSTVDIPATILDMAGIQKPRQFRGNSIIRENQDNQGNCEDSNAVFIQISESQVGRALRTKKWKYSVKAPYRFGFFQKDSDLYMEEFLYDLEKDPYENLNLVKKEEYSDIRKKLAELLKQKIFEIEGIHAEIVPWKSKWRRLKHSFNFFR